MTIVHRADLCRILYEELPESIKAKVIPAKQVQQLDQTDDAVTATCADGSQYIGTIVIGADGVYSQTRRQMREAALRADPSAEWDQEEPFEAAYKCLWCSFPRPEKAQVGLGTDTQDHDRSTMFLSGKDRGWIFLYEKLDSPTRQRNRYTTEDIEAYASRFYDMPVTESIKVRDVFTAKTAGMSNLGEGVIKNWSMGRFVLVGDAIHKFTPNAGLGLNSGIQDVVALCNQLKTLVARPSKGPYTVAQVSKAFEAYRSARLSYWQTELAQSVFVSRLHAWPSVWRKMSSRYIFNRKIVEYLALRFVAVRKARKSLLLDYSPVVEPIAAH